MPPPQCGERFHSYCSSAYIFLSRAFIFTGYAQPQKILLGNIFGLILKTRWPPEPFFDFFSQFFHILLLWLCHCHSFQTFKRNKFYKRFLENIVFGACVCVCVHWLCGLNLLFALCSKYYSIYIDQTFNISSLVLGVVIAQFWSLCSDWLFIFWSRCRDLHTCCFQKCLYLAYYLFLRFAIHTQPLGNHMLQIIW